MFPTSRFRIVYDSLAKRYTPQSAAKRYLIILNIAAKESETAIDNALNILIDQGVAIDEKQVEGLMSPGKPNSPQSSGIQIAALKDIW